MTGTGSSIKNLGVVEWGGGRDINLHRNYWVKFLLETDDIEDGPQIMTFAPGLPAVGAPWIYGNENDQWALCNPVVECETVVKRESQYWWILKYEFSTKPWLACLTEQLTHPASQPDLVSGSFANYKKRTCQRRSNGETGPGSNGETGTGSNGETGTGSNGETGTGSEIGTGTTLYGIMSSSLEPIWVEKDKNKPTVEIQQTRLNLELALLSEMIDTLNDDTLWGMPARHVKLHNAPWKRLVWGKCNYYYQRNLQFEVDYDSFDETEIIDVGHRVIDPAKLKEDPGLDRTDPENFTRSVDSRGNINKVVMLNGQGEQCSDPVHHQHFIPKVELYEESNFLLLGVPVVL